MVSVFGILIGLVIVCLVWKYLVSFSPHWLNEYYTFKLRQEQLEAQRPELKQQRREKFRQYVAGLQERAAVKPRSDSEKGEPNATVPPANAG